MKKSKKCEEIAKILISTTEILNIVIEKKYPKTVKTIEIKINTEDGYEIYAKG